MHRMHRQFANARCKKNIECQDFIGASIGVARRETTVALAIHVPRITIFGNTMLALTAPVVGHSVGADPVNRRLSRLRRR